MAKKYLTASRLEKELALLDHGFYDDKVWDLVRSEIEKSMKKHPESNGMACEHNSSICQKCARIMWFKEKFRW